MDVDGERFFPAPTPWPAVVEQIRKIGNDNMADSILQFQPHYPQLQARPMPPSAPHAAAAMLHLQQQAHRQGGPRPPFRGPAPVQQAPNVMPQLRPSPNLQQLHHHHWNSRPPRFPQQFQASNQFGPPPGLHMTPGLPPSQMALRYNKIQYFLLFCDNFSKVQNFDKV